MLGVSCVGAVLLDEGRGGRGWFCAFGSLEDIELEWLCACAAADDAAERGLGVLSAAVCEFAGAFDAQLAVAGNAGLSVLLFEAWLFIAEDDPPCSFHACLRLTISSRLVLAALAACCIYALLLFV